MLSSPSVRSTVNRNGWVMPGMPAVPQNSATSDHPNAASTPTETRVSIVVAPVPQVGPGGAVERPGAPHDDRRGQRERGPLPVGELPGGDHREQHDRGAEQRGDHEPLAQRVGGDGLGLARPRRSRAAGGAGSSAAYPAAATVASSSSTPTVAGWLTRAFSVA